MADHTGGSTEQKGQFAPRQAVQLNPPKDDPITEEYLSKCNGKLSTVQISCSTDACSHLMLPTNLDEALDSYLCISFANCVLGEQEGYPTYVAIKVSRPMFYNGPAP